MLVSACDFESETKQLLELHKSHRHVLTSQIQEFSSTVIMKYTLPRLNETFVHCFVNVF